MILVIGEMAEEYVQVKNDEFRMCFSGIGYKWAKKLPQSFFLTVLSRDRAGGMMQGELENDGIRYAKDLVSLLPSPIIGLDNHYKGSAPLSLSAEDIMSNVSELEISSVLISSVLLSYNPSASAIYDALSFLSSELKVAIDDSIRPAEGAMLLAQTIGAFRSDFSNLIISSNESEILSFLAE